jgi:hypothetical protein
MFILEVVFLIRRIYDFSLSTYYRDQFLNKQILQRLKQNTRTKNKIWYIAMTKNKKEKVKNGIFVGTSSMIKATFFSIRK